MSLATLLNQQTTTTPNSTQQWLNAITPEDRQQFWDAINTGTPTLHLHNACVARGHELGIPYKPSDTTFRRHLKDLVHP